MKHWIKVAFMPCLALALCGAFWYTQVKIPYDEAVSEFNTAADDAKTENSRLQEAISKAQNTIESSMRPRNDESIVLLKSSIDKALNEMVNIPDLPNDTEGIKKATNDLRKTVDYSTIISELDEREAPFEQTETQRAYNQAIDIKKDDLEKDSIQNYSYQGILISKEEVDEVVFSETLGQGAVYRSLARQLEGFFLFKDKYGTNESLYQRILGFGRPESWEETKPYVDKAMSIVLCKEPLGEILSKLEGLNESEGTFDFVEANFNFSIKDSAKAAAELGISEEMLGYILALLDEYGAETTFDGSYLTCSLEYLRQNGLSEKDFDEYDGFGSTSSIIGSGDGYKGVVYDAANENDKDWIYATNRGIQILHSKNAVLLSYGLGKSGAVTKWSDAIYEAMTYNGQEQAAFFEQATSYLAYAYNEEMQLIFYFNQDSEVIAFFYADKIIY